MTLGFLLAGPVSGTLSDRFGSRLFAISGMVLMAVTFVALVLIPVDFDFWVFAVLIFLNGLGGGIFTSPNTAAIMLAVPAAARGVASGIRATFTNAGMSLSIGIFFSLMIVGLADSLPDTLSTGLQQQGVPLTEAHRIAGLPPVGSLFAAFLGYNPIGELLGPSGALAQPGVQASVLTGKEFFPHLIAGPFHAGLVVVFSAAAMMMLIGGRLLGQSRPHSRPRRRLGQIVGRIGPQSHWPVPRHAARGLAFTAGSTGRGTRSPSRYRYRRAAGPPVGRPT